MFFTDLFKVFNRQKPPKKNFRQDLKKLGIKLKNREYFAFSKFADGELSILKGLPISNGEFEFDPNNEIDSNYREKLIDAFRYKNPGYYVGIGCPCCIGKKDFFWMKEFSQQDDEHLTWANIFVNSNYEYYLREFVKGEFRKRKIVLVCNKRANLGGLPFKVEKVFRVGKNAWKQNYGIIEEMKKWIQKDKIRDALFLFCAGPLGNLLAHQLFDFAGRNTYLDIGSTLDVYFGLGQTRGYLKGGKNLRKVCIWI